MTVNFWSTRDKHLCHKMPPFELEHSFVFSTMFTPDLFKATNMGDYYQHKILALKCFVMAR